MPQKLLHHFLFLFIFFQNAFAGDFEGNFTVVKESCYDTTIYNFLVKKNWIRIDQKNSKNQNLQSIIIDTYIEKIVVLSTKNKLYTNIRSNYRHQDNQNNITIIPSQNFKMVNGLKCYLWRIRDENINSEFSYWVYDSEYDFFQKMIRLLNGTADFANIFYSYSEIENANGIPILTVERTLLREEKSKLTMSSFINRKINSNLFEIPKDYKFLKQ